MTYASHYDFVKRQCFGFFVEGRESVAMITTVEANTDLRHCRIGKITIKASQ